MDMKQHPLYSLIKMMSVPEFDADSYVESESFARIAENQELMRFADDEGCAEVLAYWRERGLIKQLHDTQSVSTKWASFLPVSSLTQKNRKYPLLFVMHGSGNPILLAETYGYTHIAAREELIVIIPEDETPDNMEKLFAYAREHYPVDWTQVYMVGYSLGGYMTQRHALRWPERFAAVGSGGMLFANGYAIGETQAGKYWEGETITPEMVQHAAQLRMPAIITMGEQEVLGLLPVTQDEPRNAWKEHLDEKEKARSGKEEPKSERIDLSARNKIQSINNWRIANGCAPIPENAVYKAAATSADIVEEKLGFPFERTQVITREHRSHFVGDSVDANGESTFRVVGIARAPHWISQAQAELTWEFIRQFRVDPDTGRSYRI